MTHPTVSSPFVFFENPLFLEAPSTSICLEHEQLQRFHSLLQAQILLEPKEDFREKFWSVERKIGEIFSFLLSFSPPKKLHLIGGAAAHIIGGDQSYLDIDLAFFDEENPLEAYQAYKVYIVDLVQQWVNYARPHGKRALSSAEVIDIYFYKSIDRHLCLSFGNVDVKILKPGARPHLFDDDSLSLVLESCSLENSRITLVPNALTQDLPYVLNLFKYKILVLSQPETAYAFHFRVFKKFCNGFLVPQDLMDLTLEHMAKNFTQNPFFKESLRFFCLNHLKRETVLNFKLNLHNALFFSEKIPESLVERMLTAIDEELDQFLGYFPQRVAWDPYKELLSVLSSALLVNPEKLLLKNHAFSILDNHFYMPKNFKATVDDIFHFLSQDSQTCLKLSRNALLLYCAEPGISAEQVKIFFEELFELFHKKFPLTEVLTAEWEKMAKNHKIAPLSQKDPLQYLKNLNKTHSLSKEVFQELMPECILRGRYSEDELKDFLLQFPPDQALEEKRLFLRKFALDPEKRPSFSDTERLLGKFFGENLYEEFLELFPKTFFERCSRFIEDDVFCVAEKTPLLDWIERKGHFSKLSWKAHERYEIYTLSMPLSKAVCVFLKKGMGERFFSWIQDAYDQSPNRERFFLELKNEAARIKDLFSFYTLMISLETGQLFSREALLSPPAAKLSPLGCEGFFYLKIHHFCDQLTEQELMIALGALPKDKIALLKEPLFQFLFKAALEDKPVSASFLQSLFEDFRLESVIADVHSQLVDPVAVDRVLYLIKDKLDLPTSKNRDFVAQILELIKRGPSIVEKDPDSRLVENFLRSVNETQLIEIKGQIKESIYQLFVLKKGLKTKFFGLMEFKKEFIMACFSKNSQTKELEVPDVLLLLEDLLIKHDQKSFCYPFLSAYASRSKKNAAEVFELLAKLDFCPLEMLDSLEMLLKHHSDLQFSHSVKWKLRTLFARTRLEDFFEAFELFDEIKEGIEVLRTSQSDLLKRDPRVLKRLAGCLDKGAVKGDIESLLILLSSALYLSHDEQSFFLLAKLIEKKDLLTTKSEHLLLSILVELLEKDFESTLNLCKDKVPILQYLDRNLIHISKVPIRLALFKHFLLNNDFHFQTHHLAVLNAFVNKKNLEFFFWNFVQDATVAKCFTLYQECAAPEECFRIFFPILSYPQILEKVHPDTVAQGLRAIFSCKDWDQIPFSMQIDLFMLFEKTHQRIEPSLAKNFLDNPSATTLKPHQVQWLVDHFCTLENDPELVASASVQFIEGFLFSRENSASVLKVLDVLTHRVDLSDEQAERIARIVMHQELIHPDLVEAMSKFLDRYEATLFFPALSKSRDLAFLYLLSQRAPSPDIFEKMQIRMGVFFQELSKFKGDFLERITERIAFGYAANISSKPLDGKKELFQALLAPIRHKRCYPASWLKIFLEDSDLVFSHTERLFSFEEDLECLTPLQISSLLQWKCHLFKNKIEQEGAPFADLQMLRNFFSVNEKEGVCGTKQKEEVASVILQTFPQEGPPLVALYNQYKESLTHPELFHFYVDTLFADMTKGLECLKKLYLQSSNEKERIKIAETLAVCLETFVVLSQFDINKPKLDFKIVNPILKDFLGDIPVEHYFKIVDQIFNSFVDFLKIFPQGFDGQKAELQIFFKIFVEKLFYKRVGDPEILKDYFRFFGNATRAKNVFLVDLAADLIGSFFCMTMDAQQISTQEEMIRQQGHIFSSSYESSISCLLDFYDKNLYNKARFIYEQYKLVFHKGLPLLDQRFITDLIYYDLDIPNCKKTLETYEQLLTKKGEGKEKIHFMQRIAGRVLFLLDNKGGWIDKEFVQAIGDFYTTQAFQLLENKELFQEVGLEVSHTVMYLYASLLGSLIENSLKASMKENTHKKALLNATQICFSKLQDLMVLLPRLFIPSLSPLFSKIFPNIERMLDRQFSFIEKDPEIAKEKSWVRTKFLKFMLQAIATFNTCRPEIVDITTLLYSYFRLLDREIMGAKNPSHSRLYMLEKCRTLVGCGLHDVASQALQSKEEIQFFIEHFLENLDSIPTLGENRKREILTQYHSWMQQVVKKGLPKACLGKLQPQVDRVFSRIQKDS